MLLTGLQRFKNAFESAQEKMSALLGKPQAKASEDADKAAESLEKLAVKKEEETPEAKAEDQTKSEEKKE